MRSHESLIGTRRPGQREPTGVEWGTQSTTGSLTEWTARPLGRLGRPLVAEIETYLAFFSIARDDRDS